MKGQIKERIIVTIILIISCMVCFTGCGKRESEQSISISYPEYENSLSETYSEIEQNLNQKKEELDEKIAEVDSKVQELSNKESDYETQKQEAQNMLEELSKKIELAQERFNELNEAIENSGYAARKARDTISVSLVVNSDDTTYANMEFYQSSKDALENQIPVNSTDVVMYIDPFDGMSDKITVNLTKEDGKLYSWEVSKQKEMFSFSANVSEGVNVMEVTYTFEDKEYTFYLAIKA